MARGKDRKHSLRPADNRMASRTEWPWGYHESATYQVQARSLWVPLLNPVSGPLYQDTSEAISMAVSSVHYGTSYLACLGVLARFENTPRVRECNGSGGSSKLLEVQPIHWSLVGDQNEHLFLGRAKFMQDDHDLVMPCGRYGVERISVLTARRGVCSSFKGPPSIARGICGAANFWGKVPTSKSDTITFTDNSRDTLPIHTSHIYTTTRVDV